MTKKTGLLATMLLSLVTLSAQPIIEQRQAIPFSSVRVNDNFWLPRLQRHKQTTLPMCIQQIERETGRIRNFENAAKELTNPAFNTEEVHERPQHSGVYFDDSDVYKAMEGMSYSITVQPDKNIENILDKWIGLIEKSQWKDGYINTFYTLTDPQKRWTDMDRHEMYCIGHMIESGVAYYQATGKRNLLDVCCHAADHLEKVFGHDGKKWVPGHEEIELALARLSVLTGEKRYLDLALHLLEQRGHGLGHHIDADWGNTPWDKVYHQDEVPVSQLRNAGGHAVRLMYLLCAMTDVTKLHPDADYTESLHNLWQDIVERNMYVTGGIGQSRHNEGFTSDYDLPNEEAYCETCASIGMAMWSIRMNEMTGNAHYADILERTLYNALLAGINLKGDKFFYVNPLYSKGGHHRQSWYGCACCPSNMSRFLPSLPGYIYTTSATTAYVNLYIGNNATLTFADGRQCEIDMQTNYPWDGTVTLLLKGNNWKGKTLQLRLPEWCEKFTVSVNNKQKKVKTTNGYAVLNQKWKGNDIITLNMDMPIRITADNPKVKNNKGMRTIQRGPLVYCAESVDNKQDIDSLAISSETEISIATPCDSLDRLLPLEVTKGTDKYILIPYYAWDNRTAGKMKVWFPYEGDR